MFNILKLLLAIIGVSFLTEVSFGQGDAPAILKGLNQADKSIGAFIRTPNGQVTKISSSSALIETGNNNILENPNFEHSVYDTSWIIGSGTSSKVDVNIDNTKVFSGLNALKMTMAAASLGVFNVSPTGNQAYKDGVQGLVSVRIKTTVSGIRACQRKGFAITTNCVNVTPDGKWNLYKIPSILGEFYNGVEITSSPAVVTGDVYIDDAFVGAINLESQNGACITSDCTTTFSAFVSSAGVVSGENVDFINGNAVITSTDVFTITFNTGVFTVAPNFGYKMFNEYGTGTTTIINNNATITAATAAIDFLSVSGTGATNIALTSGFWVTFTKSGADFTQAEAKKTGNVFTTQCGADCVDTYSAIIASTTTDVVTSENVDFINGNCTTATVGRSTCTFNSGIATQALSCGCSPVINAANRACSVLVQSSSSVLVSTTSGGVEADGIGFNLICQKQGADFVATRNIVGSFNEVVTSPGISKPKICHYAFGGASATLASPTLCTTGTCVETYDSCGTGTAPSFNTTGTYDNITFASGTFSSSSFIDCECKAFSNVTGNGRDCQTYFITGEQTWLTNSSGGLVLNLIAVQSASTTAANSYVTVTCKGEAP